MLKRYEREVKSIYDVRDVAKKYSEFLRSYSCKPDREKFPFPKVGTVLDEDKSVKWNREEVERLRGVYDEEVRRLNTEKNHICNIFEGRMKELLKDEFELNDAETNVIWFKAWEDGHDSGIYNVVSHFEDLAYFYEELKTAHKKRK
jgi:hypothetical protein